MGLFSSGPSLILPPMTGVNVPDWLNEQLPDPGKLLFSLYRRTDVAVQDQVAAELARVRFPSGGYDLREYGKYDKRSGPLGLLWWITAGDWMRVQVWACADLGRSQKREVESSVTRLCMEQGIPTAATWALHAWQSVDRRAPDVDVLARMLDSGYKEQLSTITHDMFIDSIKKWRS